MLKKILLLSAIGYATMCNKVRWHKLNFLYKKIKTRILILQKPTDSRFFFTGGPGWPVTRSCSGSGISACLGVLAEAETFGR